MKYCFYKKVKGERFAPNIFNYLFVPKQYTYKYTYMQIHVVKVLLKSFRKCKRKNNWSKLKDYTGW